MSRIEITSFKLTAEDHEALRRIAAAESRGNKSAALRSLIRRAAAAAQAATPAPETRRAA